ncbi:FUN14 domain-containing protein [Halorientalis pallida]|uniref:FUN14 family protein n=1 Tax=Halorientalis pallida TaxID=2479928 RepID=A0A498KST4_9EURY|nr:FUN14 domain-containing protein [Halorientalis pallida]RXK47827.1 hypothetical protein EAF64_14350 [Halorientalis pallida]
MVTGTEAVATGFLGAGAIGGVIGYAVKKLAKVVAVLAGLELGFLAYLEQIGIITVDWSAFASTLGSGTLGLVVDGASLSGSSPLLGLLGTLPVGTGFAGGLYLGLKKG